MNARKKLVGTPLTSGGVVTGLELAAGKPRGNVSRPVAPERAMKMKARPQIAVLEPPVALGVASFAAASIPRLVAMKEASLSISAAGRLVMSRGQVRQRLREMVLVETGYDLDDLPEEALFPQRMSAWTRMGWQIPLQSTYFCEVKCRVGVNALRGASTPDKLVEAIWNAIPRAHRA